MNFKVSTKNVQEDKGIVYLLEIHMEEKILVKIGITSRPKIEDRVTEILVSIFKSYRYFPYLRPKRFTKTSDIMTKEAMLHKYFEERRYITEHKWGGSTEVFDIPLDEAVEVYERVLKGEDINESRQEEDIPR